MNATRLGDNCSGHDACSPRPLISASENVFVNGLGAGRVGDQYASHSCTEHPSHNDHIAAGSSTVFINGKNFSNVKEKQRSALRFKELGFILQASNLIPFLSVNDQLKLVNKVEKKPFDQKATDKLLEDLGVLSLKNSYPKDLSGGERQRVAIARALYHHPSVILADEPTASLDSEKAFEVVEILAKETKEKQKATIMVTHDQRLIERCDKVYEMRDGILKLL